LGTFGFGTDGFYWKVFGQVWKPVDGVFVDCRYAVFHFWKIFQPVEVWIVVKLLFEVFESFVFLFEFFYKLDATVFQVLHVFLEVFDLFLVRPIFL
jgi:hypothetical protein